MAAMDPDLQEPENRNAVAETVARYNQVAAEFAALWSSLHLQRQLQAFAQCVGGQRLVLDLGCGPGRDMRFLIDLGCQVVGLDLSTAMLSQARQRLPGAPLIQADLRYVPLATGTLDGAWACASLLHLPHAQLPAALAEVARLLRPGGVFYLAVKGGTGHRWLTDQVGRRYFVAFYQPTELETALVMSGFQVLESWVAADQAGRNEPWINIIAKA
jgi:SAM-dependent methyltransferase